MIGAIILDLGGLIGAIIGTMIVLLAYRKVAGGGHHRRPTTV